MPALTLCRLILLFAAMNRLVRIHAAIVRRACCLRSAGSQICASCAQNDADAGVAYCRQEQQGRAGAARWWRARRPDYSERRSLPAEAVRQRDADSGGQRDAGLHFARRRVRRAARSRLTGPTADAHLSFGGVVLALQPARPGRAGIGRCPQARTAASAARAAGTPACDGREQPPSEKRRRRRRPIRSQPQPIQRQNASQTSIGDLPEAAIERFTRKVQPVLVNNCTTSGCHQPGGTQKFQLDRAILHGMANRRSTMHNLAATLELVDRERPQLSPLLTMPREAHGGMEEPVFGPRQEQAFRHLVEWVALVTNAVTAEREESPAATEAIQCRRRGVAVAIDVAGAAECHVGMESLTASDTPPVDRTSGNGQTQERPAETLSSRFDEPVTPSRGTAAALRGTAQAVAATRSVRSGDFQPPTRPRSSNRDRAAPERIEQTLRR